MKYSRPNTARRSAAAVLAALLIAAWCALPAAADDEGTPLPPTETVSTPSTDGCEQRQAPPQAQDTSEAVPSGSATPAPLPVPAAPVGGKLLGDCGIVVPQGASSLPSDITARAWLIADLDTGDVLAAKDPHGRYRPASTLKLLTMNALLPRLTDLDRVIVGTDEDADMEGSRVGIGPGGRYTVRQLMLFLMMGSGNDVANALARANGGTARTLAQMNARAQALGAFDTRAATVTGLDGPGQSTSVYDLALIARSDMKMAPFPELVATKYSQVPGYGSYDAFGIANDNALLFGYEGALGGKTGFTTSAGNTYVGMAERNGRRLVVTMLAGTQQPRKQWMQAASLLDWGFAQRAGTTPIGFLVSSGEQARAGSFGEGSPPSTSATPAPPSGTVTLGGSVASGGSTALPSLAETPATGMAPAAAEDSGGISGAIVVWIGIGVLAALAVLLVVAGLRGTVRDRHPD